eukprot:g7550.t1
MFASLVQPVPTSRDVLGKFAASIGGRVAVIDPTSKVTLTWEKYVSKRNKIANSLLARGLKPGVKVALLGQNSAFWLLARSAVEVIAGVTIPINWHLAHTEVAYLLGNCDAEVLFMDEAFLSSLELALDEPEYNKKLSESLKHVVIMQIESLPHHQALNLVSSSLLCSGIKFASMDQLLKSSSALFPDVQGVPTSFLYTGGLAGKPKAAIRQERVTTEERQQYLQRFELMHATDPDQVQLVTAPLYHTAPYYWTLLAQTSGGTLLVLRKFEPGQVVRLMARHKVSNAFLPPLYLTQLVSQQYQPALKKLRGIRSIVISGAPCPQPIKETALEIFGPVVYEFYGSSELGVLTVLEPRHVKMKPNSCGRVAPGSELKSCDVKGQELPAGTPGLLYARLDKGGQSLVGYYKDEDNQFKRSLHPLDPCWFTVGDVGTLDKDGFVFISDRHADLIIAGETRIFPAEIEAVLMEHPSIAEVAVFGVPDSTFGERVHAAIRLKPEAYSLNVEQVQAFCRDKLAEEKHPVEVSLHTAPFPRSAAGAINKKALRALYRPTVAAKL